MPDPSRVELTVPISEDELLAYLLSRYPAGELERVGISYKNSVIRDFQVLPDGKCTFRVSVITGVNAEHVLEEASKAVIEEAETQNALEEGATCVDCTGEVVTSSETPACPVQQLRALRVKKSKK